MRTIKFRAWNKEYQRMFLWEKQESDMLRDVWLKHPEDYDVMQFTGLLDKNGKEVYEGDIVSEGEGCWYGKIEFDDETLTWGLLPLGKSTGSNSIYACSHALVIGNIFENPNLLK